MTIIALPELGQLVQVRSRPWVVNDVKASCLPTPAMRVALKVETIREDLGKVGNVIALQIEEAMLGHRKELDTAKAENEAEPIRKMLKFERDLQKQVKALMDQYRETRRELRLSPENICQVVQVGLALAGQPLLTRYFTTEYTEYTEDKSSAVTDRDNNNGKRVSRKSAAFDLVSIPSSLPCIPSILWSIPPLKGSWASCAEGLEHPHTKELRPITFDETVSRGRDDVVLVHLNHRLGYCGRSTAIGWSR